MSVSEVSRNVNYQNVIAMTELPVLILLTSVDVKIPRTALWDSFGDFRANQMTFSSEPQLDLLPLEV